MKTRGFTLIELMIVVSIIGILAAVAIPKFSDLLTKSKEGRLKSALGTIRSAISIYYGDNTTYPGDLTVGLTTGGRYILELPRVEIPATTNQGNPGHPMDNTVANLIDDAVTSNWVYFITSTDEGQVLVNCTHNDSRGTVWTSQ